VGGKDQKNDAHFLEMAGALAILDFCKNIKKTTTTTQIKEFGVENETDSLNFNDLNIENSNDILAPLTKFKLYTEYLKKGLPKAMNVSRWTKSNIKMVKGSKNSVLDKNYFQSAEYKLQIEAFNNYFEEWLKEMGQNKPAFNPFNTVDWNNSLNLLKGKSPKGNVSFKILDIENCKLIDDRDLDASDDRKHTTLIKLFSKSTENVLSKRNLLNR
jgi:hypothetical protein